MAILRYLKQLSDLWVTRITTILDLIFFVASLASQSFSPPTWFYWLIAGVGFFIANIQIYIGMEKEINKYKAQEANIVVKVLNSNLIVHKPYLDITKIRVKNTRSNDGLDDIGLPIVTELWAKVEIENIGVEEGELVWKNDNQDRAELPPFFLIYQNNIDGHFNNSTENQPYKIKGRIRFEDHWIIDLYLQENDPEIFAKRISDTPNYRLFLNYWTKRVGGETEKRTIIIEGDLTNYRDELAKKWSHRNNMDNLIRIATNTPRPTAIG